MAKSILTLAAIIAESLTLQQIATEVGCHVNGIRDNAAHGKLKTFRVGNGPKAKVYATRADVDAFKASGHAPTPRPRAKTTASVPVDQQTFIAPAMGAELVNSGTGG